MHVVKINLESFGPVQLSGASKMSRIANFITEGKRVFFKDIATIGVRSGAETCDLPSLAIVCVVYRRK